MPLHRVRKGDRPIEDLDRAVTALERQGRKVVQVVSWSNEWALLTETSSEVETRADTTKPPSSGSKTETRKKTSSKSGSSKGSAKSKRRGAK